MIILLVYWHCFLFFLGPIINELVILSYLLISCKFILFNFDLTSHNFAYLKIVLRPCFTLIQSVIVILIIRFINVADALTWRERRHTDQLMVKNIYFLRWISSSRSFSFITYNFSLKSKARILFNVYFLFIDWFLQ